jgi:hypothetical protein
VQNTVRSDGAGRFRFRDLQPARYELVASLPGFATVTNIMPLAAGATVERIITLPVGMLQETITVNCAAPVARRSSVLQYVRTSVDGGGTPLLWRNSTRATPPVAAQAPSPAAQDPRPVRVGGVIKAPRQLSNVAPRCPPLLPPPGTVVTLTGRIGVDGYMNEVRMVEPAPGEIAPLPEFVDAALDAVRQWTYTPTLLNNVTVEVTVQVTVYFGG